LEQRRPGARQTAEILAARLPSVPLHPADPILAEGQPAVPYPQKGKGDVRASTLWEDSARIELAFRRYVHRDVCHKRLAEREAHEAKARLKQQGDPKDADYHPESQNGLASNPLSTGDAAAKQQEHTFEIIVCHCNVIRYFVMRALQLPPEAWLRMGGYNTGVTEVIVRPDGKVSLARFGDTGHLPLEMVTFH